MPSTRRRFVSWAIYSAGAATFGTVWLRRHQRLDAVAERFEAFFHYLDLDRAGLDRFLADYESEIGVLTDWIGRPVEPLPFMKFLESTDFFPNGADENRAVRYIMLRDPYVNPCFNPFSA
ncbi:MAG: hypothetical protein AAF657_40560 [Acidobacteriota bacterium]